MPQTSDTPIRSSKHDDVVTKAAFIIMATIVIRKRRKRRWCVEKIYQKRLKYGNRFLKYVRFKIDDPNFVRMSHQDFEHLVQLIKPTVTKCNTYMRDGITVTEHSYS